NYVQSDLRHPMDFVCDFLKAKKRDKQTIAVELDAYYFTAQCYIRLSVGMPDARFRDGTTLVNWVRIIKSDQVIDYIKKAARITDRTNLVNWIHMNNSDHEIEYIKKAALISEKAMQVAFDTLDVGVRECDVVAGISYAQISGTEEFGGDYPSIVPLLPTGKKTSACHLTWTDETFKEGQHVIIELAGCYRRYHAPLARTAVIGVPSEELQTLSKVVVEGLNTALDVIKPGITAGEVERVWRKSIEKNGVKKESRIGYSMGLNYPPDWGEHTASFRSGDQTILEPNMTFHMIPTMD